VFIPDSQYKTVLASMPILCVDLLIIHKDKFLLLKRDNEPAKGEYWFPGGRVLKLETIKSAALRKSKLEVNLECVFHHIVSIEETIFKRNSQMSTDVHTVNVVCKLTCNNIDKIKHDNLHTNYLWSSFKNIIDLNLHIALLNPLKIELGKLDTIN
jgi:colanic acid biosynthesis protein WcaH